MVWISQEFNIGREEAALQTKRHRDLTSASVSILCPEAKSMRLHQNTDHAEAEADDAEAQTSDLYP